MYEQSGWMEDDPDTVSLLRAEYLSPQDALDCQKWRLRAIAQNLNNRAKELDRGMKECQRSLEFQDVADIVDQVNSLYSALFCYEMAVDCVAAQIGPEC